MTASAALRRLRERLGRETKAEARFDPGSRLLHATDASLYQIEPLGVVAPRTQAEVGVIVRIAADEGIPILPRGAATSLSGQTVGPALILDFSKYLNRIGIIDRDRSLIRVEPGVVLDRLNAHLKPFGLMFGPDVATSDRATLGGMIGNNSAGARSSRYGKTVDHVHSLEAVLADGTPAYLEPLSETALASVCRRTDRVSVIHRSVRDIVSAHRDAIARNFPRVLRRVSGYNLDEFIPGLSIRPDGWPDEPWRFNLSRLVVGSEGTLAVVTAAHLEVVRLPKAIGLVVLSFRSIADALLCVSEIMETRPVSVELLDRAILDLASRNAGMAQHLGFAVGQPEAVLAVQFYADSDEDLADRSARLIGRFEASRSVLGVCPLAGAAGDHFWEIRKAGLALLMGMVGDAKPVAFVEDTAVNLDRLPEFHRRFQAILAQHRAEASCYGHADVGCLHVRPILNLKTQHGVEQLRAIAREVSDLVLEFGAAMSGEHGDGLARTIWNRKLFGDEVYAAFGAIKDIFDPAQLLNPGKVVGESDPATHLRIGPDYRTREPAQTAFDFSSQGGFGRAVEMCSGVGVCRKRTGGTMCPSYMVTGEERHSTRGRANALRLVLSGQLPADGLSNETLNEALDLCLQCKACKTECPSNVDMAKLKAEVRHQQLKGRAVPLADLLLGHIDRMAPIASMFSPLTNWSLRQTATKWLLEQVAGIDRRRTLPAFHRDHLRRWFGRRAVDPRAGSRGEVILLDDCFTTYNDPKVGRAAVTVLEASGYRVKLAGLRCCGRAAISKGLLDRARMLARENVAKLVTDARRGVPILGCEPSCLTTLVDEYLDFRLGPAAKAVAAMSLPVESFLADPDRVPALPLNPFPGTVLFHGHCHQKALIGTEGSLSALRRIPELTIRELDSGCCGMAGSFGYDRDHYEVSVALAQRVILPSVQASPEALLVAPGFSCRSQVHDLAGIEALHPVELLARQLI